MYCRRCGTGKLIELERIDVADDLVYRCWDCGYIFSPGEHALALERELAPYPRRKKRSARSRQEH